MWASPSGAAELAFTAKRAGTSRRRAGAQHALKARVNPAIKPPVGHTCCNREGLLAARIKCGLVERKCAVAEVARFACVHGDCARGWARECTRRCSCRRAKERVNAKSSRGQRVLADRRVTQTCPQSCVLGALEL